MVFLGDARPPVQLLNHPSEPVDIGDVAVFGISPQVPSSLPRFHAEQSPADTPRRLLEALDR